MGIRVRQLTTSPLNAFLGHTIKQLIAFHVSVESPQDKPVPINMLYVTNTHGPAFNTRSQTHQCPSLDTSTSQPRYHTRQFQTATDPT